MAGPWCRTPPAVELNFSTAALSVLLFRNRIRNRTVPAITVSLKMIIGLRGIMTVEL
jgi:hypothetical protein